MTVCEQIELDCFLRRILRDPDLSIAVKKLGYRPRSDGMCVQKESQPFAAGWRGCGSTKLTESAETMQVQSSFRELAAR